MKWWIFKVSILVVLVASFSIPSVAQKHSKENRYAPDCVKVQYAGSMGLFSVGPSWEYGRRKQWETDLMLGIIPKYSTDNTKVCLTLKQNFTPWDISLGNKKFILEPLACGLYLTSVFGEEFWGKEPSKYPNGYYNFSTKVRINIYLGQRLTYLIPTKKVDGERRITFFYEISSNELYIVRAVGNSYLKPKDYLHLSLGLKLDIF